MLKKMILLFLVIATCVVIFNFSSTEGATSNKQSEAVTQKVEEVVTDITGKKPSRSTVENIHAFIRKQGHFIEFAFLGLFLFLLTRCYDLSFRMSFIITLSFVFIYACTDEIHQLFVKGRNGCIKDVFIDFAGGCVGTLLAAFPGIIRIKKQSKKL